MRIIGIDPGLRRLGWGVIDVEANRIRYIACGVCTSGEGDLSLRLLRLHQALSAVFIRHQPEEAAVEQTFVNKDGVATLKLGQARAICLLVPAQNSVSIAEYAPNAVKKTVVGAGHADKAQVAHMVRLQLPGAPTDQPDATDALAIALCHAHQSRLNRRLDARILHAKVAL